MPAPKNLGHTLLAVYLILSGAIALLPFLGALHILVPILAIGAGVCLLIGR